MSCKIKNSYIPKAKGMPLHFTNGPVRWNPTESDVPTKNTHIVINAVETTPPAAESSQVML